MYIASYVVYSPLFPTNTGPRTRYWSHLEPEIQLFLPPTVQLSYLTCNLAIAENNYCYYLIIVIIKILKMYQVTFAEFSEWCNADWGGGSYFCFWGALTPGAPAWLRSHKLLLTAECTPILFRYLAPKKFSQQLKDTKKPCNVYPATQAANATHKNTNIWHHGVAALCTCYKITDRPPIRTV